MNVKIRTLRDFDRFCNPNSHIYDGYYRYIDINCLKNRDYIIYFCIPIINGKLYGSPSLVEFDDLKKYVYCNYYVFAFNRINYVSLEVV